MYTLTNLSDLEQCCLYTFIYHFRYDSVFNLHNKTKQYFCMNYIDHACMHKFSNSWPNMCYIFKMQWVQGYQIWNHLVPWRSWRLWRSWRPWTGHITFEDILHFRTYYIYIYIYIYGAYRCPMDAIFLYGSILCSIRIGIGISSKSKLHSSVQCSDSVLHSALSAVTLVQNLKKWVFLGA